MVPIWTGAVRRDQHVDDLAGVGRDDPGIPLEPGLEQRQPGLRLAHGELPLQAGAAARRLVAHPFVGDLVPASLGGGDAALDLVGRGLRLEGIAVADHPAGFQASGRRRQSAGGWPVATDRAPWLRRSARSSCLSASALDLASSSSSWVIRAFFFPQPGQLGRGGMPPRLPAPSDRSRPARPRRARSSRPSPRPSPAAPTPAP